MAADPAGGLRPRADDRPLVPHGWALLLPALPSCRQGGVQPRRRRLLPPICRNRGEQPGFRALRRGQLARRPPTAVSGLVPDDELGRGGAGGGHAAGSDPTVRRDMKRVGAFLLFATALLSCRGRPDARDRPAGASAVPTPGGTAIGAPPPAAGALALIAPRAGDTLVEGRSYVIRWAAPVGMRISLGLATGGKDRGML